MLFAHWLLYIDNTMHRKIFEYQIRIRFINLYAYAAQLGHYRGSTNQSVAAVYSLTPPIPDLHQY